MKYTAVATATALLATVATPQAASGTQLHIVSEDGANAASQCFILASIQQLQKVQVVMLLCHFLNIRRWCADAADSCRYGLPLVLHLLPSG